MADHQFKDDLGDIADILGPDVAQELFDKLPGIEFKVPLQYSEHNPLAYVDREIAEKVIAEFPGDKFYVPVKIETQDKVSEIKRLIKAGKTPREVALLIHVTERYVRKVISSHNIPKARKVDPNQIDLIDWLKDTDNQ